MSVEKIKKAISQNYIILILAGVILLVVIASLLKTTAQEQNFIYAKIKVDRGLWWIRTQKPSIWYSAGIKKGEKEVNLLGNTTAEIIKVRNYPFFEENQVEPQYNIYITAKLSVNKNKTGEYVFKRTPVSVGSPIDIEFPSVNVSGTVIELKENQPKDELVEKTVLLSKRFAFPWEYEEIKIGDKYYDSEEIVFEVLDKSKTDTYILSQDPYGNLNSTTTEPGRYITIKAKVKVKNVQGKMVFGEEQMMIPGSPFFVVTDNYTYYDFVVTKVFN